MNKRLLGTLMFAVLCCGTMFGQYLGYGAPAIIPNQPMENHGFYSVDLQDLSIIINIPVRSKPGFSALFNGALDRVEASCDVPGLPVGCYVQPVEVNLTSGGVVNGLISANSAFQSGYVVQATCPNGKTTTYIFENWYFTDGNGTQHYLPSTFYVDNESQLGTGSSCYQASATAQTLDHTYSVTVSTSASSNHVYISYNNGGGLSGSLNKPTVAGTPWSPQSNYVAAPFTTYTDKNGNSTSANSTLTSYTDIMGLTALTSTGTGGAPTFSWTNASGGTSELAITAAPYYRKTSYGCSTVVGGIVEGWQDITDTTSVNLALNENLDKRAFYAAFRNATNSVLVAAKRCAFRSK
jgi:hypothetical protein